MILTQSRLRRWPAGIAALLGILLLAGGAAWTLSHGGGGRAANYASIAVLPFANLSGNADNEYLGDGLAEELLNALANIEGLKVAARTSAFAFKGSNIDVRVIGDTLGVATVLEGSVRRSSDHIRITAQLIDARTGYHLWSNTYDRPLADLFSVQDALAREIVNALAGRFTTSKAGLYRGGTTDVPAHDLYLAGRQKWIRREIPLLREALRDFEQAIARDSSFALAWSGLADVIDALAFRIQAEQYRVPAARYATQRALVLEPQLAEAWASLGVLAFDFDRDARLSELALRRAIALQPSYATAHSWLASTLRYQGRLDDALEENGRALDLDPLNAFFLDTRVAFLLAAGRHVEARKVADRALARGAHPRMTMINILAGVRLMGFSAEQAGRIAHDWAVASGYTKPDDIALIGRAFVDPALRPRARELLRGMTNGEMAAYEKGELYLGIEDFDAAIKQLELVNEDEAKLVLLATQYIFDPLRKDPRFRRIVEKVALPSGR